MHGGGTHYLDLSDNAGCDGGASWSLFRPFKESKTVAGEDVQAMYT